jgi:hypothetical protein
MADLSGIPDIRSLPENEAQANPLTRLKTATHRKRAWRMALRSALKKGRPVTARDAEEAVNLLSETIEPTPVNGVATMPPQSSRGRGTQMLLPIIRTDAGRFFGFGEHDGPKFDNYEGRFAQLLPPKRPGAEARCRQEPGVGARRQDDVAKARRNDSIWALIYEPAAVLSAKRC